MPLLSSFDWPLMLLGASTFGEKYLKMTCGGSYIQLSILDRKWNPARHMGLETNKHKKVG